MGPTPLPPPLADVRTDGPPSEARMSDESKSLRRAWRGADTEVNRRMGNSPSCYEQSGWAVKRCENASIVPFVPCCLGARCAMDIQHKWNVPSHARWPARRGRGRGRRAGSDIRGWVAGYVMQLGLHLCTQHVNVSHVPHYDTYCSIPSTSRYNNENGLPVYQHPHANIGLLHTVMVALICDLIA